MTCCLQKRSHSSMLPIFPASAKIYSSSFRWLLTAVASDGFASIFLIIECMKLSLTKMAPFILMQPGFPSGLDWCCTTVRERPVLSCSNFCTRMTGTWLKVLDLPEAKKTCPQCAFVVNGFRWICLAWIPILFWSNRVKLPRWISCTIWDLKSYQCHSGTLLHSEEDYTAQLLICSGKEVWKITFLRDTVFFERTR